MDRRPNYPVDTLLELKDAGAIAASAAAQVSSSDKILDLGAGAVRGDCVLDVSAIEIASNTELYEIVLEGSTKSDFADTIEELARITLGANEVITGGTDQDSATGRYVLPFRNERNGTVYRYVRLYTVVVGSVATGINYTGRLAKQTPA